MKGGVGFTFTSVSPSCDLGGSKRQRLRRTYLAATGNTKDTGIDYLFTIHLKTREGGSASEDECLI